MRSSILLASAMAIGAIAKPVDKRFVYTEVDVSVVTQTVYVYEGAAPTVEAYPHKPYSHHWSKKPKPSSVPPPPPSTPAYTPAPAPTSVYTPPPAPTSVYTPPPVETKAPSSAAPASSAPASSAAYDGAHKTGTIQATFTSGPDYQAAVIYHHNVARANHNAPPLVWDDETAANALWTAKTCNFSHSFPAGANNGQNIFTSSGDSFNVTAAIIESWYKSELPPMLPYFGQEVPSDVFHSVGHLTAMVWKDTTKVGCASYDCSGQMVFSDGTKTDMDKFTVCNYAEKVPNMGGEYAANVLAPINSNPTFSWSD